MRLKIRHNGRSSGFKLSEEQKQKMSKTMKERYPKGTNSFWRENLNKKRN